MGARKEVAEEARREWIPPVLALARLVDWVGTGWWEGTGCAGAGWWAARVRAGGLRALLFL